MAFLTAVLVVFLGAGAWALWPLIRPEPGPDYMLTIHDSATSEDRAVIEAVFKVLRRRCEGIEGYWRSFVSAEAELQRDAQADYRFERYGWTEMVRFHFKVKDRPQAGLSGADGHTLHLVAGAGHQPGVTGTKSWTKELCGMTVYKRGNQWTSVPELRDAFAVTNHP